MKRTIKSGLLAVFAAALLLGGCHAGTGMGGALKINGTPKEKYCVGGGIELKYKAPQDGICYIVDRSSGKIIETKSLEAGELVEHRIQITDFNVVEALEAIGIEPANMDLRLYFVPAPKTTSCHNQG